MNRHHVIVAIATIAFISVVPGAVFGATFNRALGIGSAGSDVTALQKTLMTAGYYTGPITGYFGFVTQSAVSAFQRASNLEPIGTVGPQTRNLLNSLVDAPSMTPITSTLKTGSKGSEVVSLQSALTTLGYYHGTKSGEFDAATKAAVIAFQKDHGISGGGTVSGMTLSVLNTFISGGLLGGTTGNTSALSLTFSASPMTVHSGKSVKFTWKTNIAAQCRGTGNWEWNDTSKRTSGSKTVSHVTSPLAFTLACTANGVTVTKSILIAIDTTPVPPSSGGGGGGGGGGSGGGGGGGSAPTSDPTPVPIPVAPTLTLTASPTSVTSGNSATLIWSSTDTTSCTASGSWSGARATSGSQVFTNLTASGAYTLTCTGAGGSVNKTASVTVSAPTPPPAGGYVVSPTLNGAADLVAAFPVTQGLAPSWGTGEIPGLYGANEGAFRLTCGGEGPLRYDDPLLYPGQSGRSHLHLFWGPTNITANTTMNTLGATVGSSNCNYGANTLNRSAYWAPALIDDGGYVRGANTISVYYKEPMANSSRCTPGSADFEGICIGLPNQIRFIFGWDPTKPNDVVQGASWYCTGGTGGHFTNLDDLFQSGCKTGDDLVADVIAPNCWDGTYLDTPDHRSHMTYPSYGDWGYQKCPATHPYLIPQNESKVDWLVTADMYQTVNGVIKSRLHLSSDHMKANAKPGETLHSDYMEQWVGAVKQMWQDNCINKGLSCNGGDLGNGLQLYGASQPAYGWVNPNPKSATTYPDMAM